MYGYIIIWYKQGNGTESENEEIWLELIDN